MNKSNEKSKPMAVWVRPKGAKDKHPFVSAVLVMNYFPDGRHAIRYRNSVFFYPADDFEVKFGARPLL